MAFREVEKTRSLRGRGAPAIFTVNKKGTGSLRFNRKGMNFIAGIGLDLKLGDMVRLFHDPETGKLAIKKTPDGPFRLAKNSTQMDTVRISSKDLTNLIKKPREYEMERSEEYDLVLAPKR